MADTSEKDPTASPSDSSDFEFPSLHEEEHQDATPKVDSVPPVVASSDLDNQPPLPKDDPAGPPELPTTEVGSPVAPVQTPLKGKISTWFVQHKQIGLALVFLVVALSMWGLTKWRARHAELSQPAEAAAPDEIPVNAVEVRLGRFQDTINAVGTLKGEAEIELRFEVDGKIQEFNASEGSKVLKGQVIARLNDRDALLKVRRAQNELTNTEKLFELGGVSRTKLDEARLNLDVAQSELDKTRIVATRDGILGDKAADIGEFVTPQRKVATLVAIRNVVVKVGIIEKQVDKVSPQQKIIVSVDAYPGSVFEGAIENISPIITGDAKTFEITAKIPNKDSLLLPGMFARSKIITYEIDDAMTVPNDALVKTTGGFQVFTVNKDNMATPVDVEVGYVSTELTQIKAGLNSGDVVIVQKPPELKAGSKVKIIEVQK